MEKTWHQSPDEDCCVLHHMSVLNCIVNSAVWMWNMDTLSSSHPSVQEITHLLPSIYLCHLMAWRIPNSKVLTQSHTYGIENIIKNQLRWAGGQPCMHVRWQNPKKFFFCQLEAEQHHLGRPCKCYKNALKENTKSAPSTPSDSEALAKNRPRWRSACHSHLRHWH